MVKREKEGRGGRDRVAGVVPADRKQETSGPFFSRHRGPESVFLTNLQPLTLVQGPDLSLTRARITLRGEEGDRPRRQPGIDRSTRHRQFNTWPKWFVSA